MGRYLVQFGKTRGRNLRLAGHGHGPAFSSVTCSRGGRCGWTPNGPTPDNTTLTHTGEPATPRRRLNWQATVLAAVAVHLGLGRAVLTNTRWTTGAVVIFLAIVALKIILGRRGLRHHKAARTHHTTNVDHDA